MPNHSNKHSRKNNKPHSKVEVKPMATSTAENDDEEFVSIIVKTAPRNTTRKQKKVTPLVPAPEPEPPKPEWEIMGMSEEDYHAYRARVTKMMMEWERENYINNLIADLDSVSYWESRINILEMSRERYNKKRGWSADDVAAVDEIDASIQECEDEIARIQEMNGEDEWYEDSVEVF